MVEVRIADYISTAETSTKNIPGNHKKQKPVSAGKQLMEVSFCFIINMQSIIYTLAKGSRD
jgi:hypothetical protein